MEQNQREISSTDDNQPPGTFLLIHSMLECSQIPVGVLLTSYPDEIEVSENHDRPQIILHPVPSRDPNEPLVSRLIQLSKLKLIARQNWSTVRKTVNFTLVLAVTVVVFTT